MLLGEGDDSSCSRSPVASGCTQSSQSFPMYCSAAGNPKGDLSCRPVPEPKKKDDALTRSPEGDRVTRPTSPSPNDSASNQKSDHPPSPPSSRPVSRRFRSITVGTILSLEVV